MTRRSEAEAAVAARAVADRAPGARWPAASAAIASAAPTAGTSSRAGRERFMAGILSGRSERGGGLFPRPISTLPVPERCSRLFLIYDIMEIVVIIPDGSVHDARGTP